VKKVDPAHIQIGFEGVAALGTLRVVQTLICSMAKPTMISIAQAARSISRERGP